MSNPMNASYFFAAVWFAICGLLVWHHRRIRRDSVRSMRLYSRAIQRRAGYLQIDLGRW